MENLIKVKSLLQKKQNALNEILALTTDYKVGDTESDAFSYIELMNKRESIITDIKRLDLELSNKKYEDILNNQSELQDNIKKLCEDIVSKDRFINTNAKVLLSKLKSKAKDYVTGKNLSNAYTMPPDEQYSFDINN